MSNITISIGPMDDASSRALARDYRPGLVWVTFCTRRSINYRSFVSQEEAEHFAAGVQAGIVSMGGSATVEIVTVSDPV
jgi:hypothetical protein